MRAFFSSTRVLLLPLLSKCFTVGSTVPLFIFSGGYSALSQSLNNPTHTISCTSHQEYRFRCYHCHIWGGVLDSSDKSIGIKDTIQCPRTWPRLYRLWLPIIHRHMITNHDYQLASTFRKCFMLGNTDDAMLGNHVTGHQGYNYQGLVL